MAYTRYAHGRSKIFVNDFLGDLSRKFSRPGFNSSYNGFRFRIRIIALTQQYIKPKPFERKNNLSKYY